MAERQEVVDDLDMEEVVEEENEARKDADDVQTLTCSYTTDAETGITSITISGTYETTITQGETDKGEIIYTSPDFKAPQQSLKAALEWIGRNVGTRTLRAEWDRQNAPLDAAASDAKTRKLQKQIKEAEERAARFEKMAMEAQANAMQESTRLTMALDAIMSKLGGIEALQPLLTDGADDAPGNSASSAKDQTESQASTARSTSRGQSKQG